MRITIIFLLFSGICFSQTTYRVSFENAEHHELEIHATYANLQKDTVVVRMSRTSPGRYALHEFMKNIYGVEATNSRGDTLEISRPDPYSWKISGHDGTIKFNYLLFANRGDGTYSQLDPTHAHLNIPATFIYAEELQEEPVEVTFDTSGRSGWEVATQLQERSTNTFWAPNLQYFMDSPTEISDFDLREFTVNGQNIRFVLHHNGTAEAFDRYFEQVKKIVEQQMKVYGELPDFDYDEYTFLACYIPNVSGDGMEHRNSTVLTSTRSLEEGGMQRNIGTVSHEFFHAWNVERIRPDSLEPFEFTEANMSGELWFAEGFTSYYTSLILARAGIITPEDYINGLNGTFNYVWNSPARQYFNPVEMSYQAPFVDAATSVEPVNRENTFISYYSYGSVLGLALDLSLRAEGRNLDDFMKLMWQKHGKPEEPYTLEDLQSTLAEYAGKSFADEFFNNYIHDSKMPDYNKLFSNVGVEMERSDEAFFGASVRSNEVGLVVADYVAKNTPAYDAGLEKGTQILSVNGKQISSEEDWQQELKNYSPGDIIELKTRRYGEESAKAVTLTSDPAYLISIDEKATKEAETRRHQWLSAK